MLEVYPESRFWLRQLRECAIGDRIDPFAESLQGAGFKRRSAQLLLRGAAHLGEWASIEQVRRHRTSGKSLCLSPGNFSNSERWRFAHSHHSQWMFLFGKLTLKVYTKGERVLRIEVVLHNAKELRCGRLLEKFTPIVTRLKQIANQFLDHVYAMDATFLGDATLDELPQPSCLGKTKIGGIDINRTRTRTVLNAALSLLVLHVDSRSVTSRPPCNR